MEFKLSILNYIQLQFLCNSNLNHLIKLKIIYFNEIDFKFYMTALYVAVKKENVEIVKLLLGNEKIDVNIINILIVLIL